MHDICFINHCLLFWLFPISNIFFYKTPYIHVPYTSAPQLASFTIYKEYCTGCKLYPACPHILFFVFLYVDEYPYIIAYH